MSDLPLRFRFGVSFLVGGLVPNTIDTRFQKVQGIAAEVTTTTIEEGGQNLFTHRVPQRVSYGNLVLERGFVVGSPLNIEFNVAMSQFAFLPSNVIVYLLNQQANPIAAWMFIKAYPVKWTSSDLDATEESLVIDTLELAYERMQTLRV